LPASIHASRAAFGHDAVVITDGRRVENRSPWWRGRESNPRPKQSGCGSAARDTLRRRADEINDGMRQKEYPGKLGEDGIRRERGPNGNSKKLIE
jgi:hypothetical protein